jgi:hypothetical protein
MLEMRRFILFGFLILTFACNRTISPKSSVNDSNYNSKIEDFYSFFSKFKSDSTFQYSRIIFPIVYESYDDIDLENPKVIIKKTNENQWRYISFYWDSTYAKRSLDAYTQDIIIRTDTTKIDYTGVNNGINIQLIFVRKGSEWYYFKLIDGSN